MNEKLTVTEAYLAMYSFLENEYKMTKSDEIGCLLGGMSFLEDGGTADPAAWESWENAIRNMKTGRVDASLKIMLHGSFVDTS